MTSKYFIKIKGYLPDHWTEMFEVTMIDIQSSLTNEPITVLTCQVQDQAELTGILNWIHNMNLTLLEVRASREDGNDV